MSDEKETQLGSNRQSRDTSFEMERRKLKEAYKLVKAGLISPDDLDKKTKYLLMKYYGMKVSGKEGEKK